MKQSDAFGFVWDDIPPGSTIGLELVVVVVVGGTTYTAERPFKLQSHVVVVVVVLDVLVLVVVFCYCTYSFLYAILYTLIYIPNRPGHETVGKVHAKQIYEISVMKQKDEHMHHLSLEAIAKSVAGSCTSMGIEVVGM